MTPRVAAIIETFIPRTKPYDKRWNERKPALSQKCTVKHS